MDTPRHGRKWLVATWSLAELTLTHLGGSGCGYCAELVVWALSSRTGSTKSLYDMLLWFGSTPFFCASVTPQKNAASSSVMNHANKVVRLNTADRRVEKRVLLSLVTGSGKTFIALQLLKKVADAGLLKRALFICDRGELRSQALGTFQNVFGADTADVYEESKTASCCPSGWWRCAPNSSGGCAKAAEPNRKRSSFAPATGTPTSRQVLSSPIRPSTIPTGAVSASRTTNAGNYRSQGMPISLGCSSHE